MKIAVRYQSRSGNTKALAEVIAKNAGVSALEITEPITEDVDVLFIGGGTYMGIDKTLVKYLEELDNTKVKRIAPFSTGSRLDILSKISEIATAKDIPITKASLAIKMGNKGVHLFPGNNNSPLSDEHIESAEKFTQNVLAEIK